VDAAGVGLIIVEDEKLPGADGDLPAVDAIPFFPLYYGFEGQTAYVVVATCLAAAGVEDDILLFEPAEMQLLVESGGVMIGQSGEIHKIEHFGTAAISCKL